MDKYIFITRTDWNEPPRARHQLAMELAKKYEVIFVSLNFFGIPSIIKSYPIKNITHIQPKWFFHGKYLFRIPFINEIYQFWLFNKIKNTYNNCRVINFDPSATLIHYFFKNVIYFCNDDFLDIKRSKFFLTKLYFYLSQRIIAKKAKFCVAVSNYLKEQLIKYCKSSYVILTAAEQLNAEVKFNKNINDNKINAVYVGWLTKINKDWILELSKKSNINIRLVGPYNKNDFKDLMKIENINFLGEKKGKDLISILKDTDVCLAPYKIGRDTKMVYTMPNKFWLYLNFGLPIVSCKIKRLYDLPDDFVYQAKDKLEFVNNVILAYSRNSLDFFSKRRLFIKSNNWENRVKQLIKLYEINYEKY